MNVNKTHYRTIWPDPDNSKIIKIIDQRFLPHQFVVEDLHTVEDFARAIKDMHVRGAGLIGATAAFAMYCSVLTAPEKDCDTHIHNSAQVLAATRPTAKNLTWAIERQLKEISKEPSLEAKKQRAFEVACEVADEDALFCKQIGEHGLKIIKDISRKKGGQPVNVLTHCNAGWLAFVDYGSATAPIYAAHHAGINIHVWVDETRPWLQGAKLTAWELKEEGVPHTLIPDNTGGHLMQHDMVDLVIVGTDRTTYTGDVANKIGTYLKALAARDNTIPFYVALPSSTFDWEIENGLKDIPIEKRSEEEVHRITGMTQDNHLETVTISPAETKAVNYGFDVTPARLITGLITERGVVAANKKDILNLFPEKKK
ncbi:MAG: S-methyl-5-thioribose-1-phosphate isomerase [Desulfobulbaceae bacterium]|uniref:Methylthioribose-1-phosphate isomerase n=1 Tax=Candidatus Desulfobia pelagia TaxID=2841692 RepID=A0A8J6TCG3_9BACT|nr:S-methyl-5-thioribose-1-phosphate isomerase [Candidatus Desulfobia pelagia]